MASQRASSSTASARASPSPLSPPADSRPPPPPADSPPPPPRDVDHIVVIHQLMRELGPRLPSDRRDQLWHTLLQQQQQQQHLQEEEEAGGSTVDQRPVTEDKEMPVPFADAPSPVRAVLNRPWPDPIVIPPASPSGKYRTLVATAKDIGPPITPEEFAALEDKEGDDLCTSHYKQAARADALMLNYIHEHGSLYMDEKNKFIFDNSILVEEIRCKYVTAEEMEANTMKRGNRSTYLPELALATYNKRRKVKFELCEQLLCRSFWEDRGFFWHLNFIVKRKGSKKLFFAEIEDCGQRSGEILQVCCCIPLDSLSEGGYYNWRSFSPSGPRKGLDLDRCYACTEFLKHPCDGLTYSGGHDYQRKTYLF